MLKNYIKTALRSFRRNKSSFLINVLGLSIGMACSILILLWVQDEWNHDTFHQDIDRIYQVMENQHYGGGSIFTVTSTPGILAPALVEEIPEIEQAVTYTYNENLLFTVGDKSLKENGIYARKDFFKVFSFDLKVGDEDQVLSKPQSAVISKSLAKKYFDEENPVGKSIEINKDEIYTVTGVFNDIAGNSSLRFDYVFPFEDWLKRNQWATQWGNNGPRTVVKLVEGSDERAVESKIKDFIKERNEGSIVELFLQPYSETYLYANFKDGKQAGGRIEYVRLFSVIAFFILLIACINFMNLSTARSTNRAKEVGIRKSVGAGRGSLVGQYLGESILISFASLVFALLLVYASLPLFNDLTDKSVYINFSEPSLLFVFAGIALVTGLIAGSYPALYLSSFEAVKVLKGTIKSSMGEVFARKGLVVFQFTLSIVLIIATLVIYNQIHFVKNKNLGYKIDNLVLFSIEGEIKDNWSTFRQELERYPEVINISSSSTIFMGRNSNTGDVEWPGKESDKDVLFEMVHTDYDLLETMGISLLEGRSFSREFGADTARVIINEAAARVMEMEQPVGQYINFWGEDWEIIGMAENFHFQSMRNQIEPLIFMLNPQYTGAGFARIESDKIQQTLGEIETLYQTFNPGFPFNYRFMDQRYEQLYRSEVRIGELSKYFAIFAIVISCLGLFGLSAFTAEKRTREIGIRKVLGATVAGLVLLLSREFTRLVLVSMVLAVPIAWWLMNQWLSNYAYRTELSWWLFGMAGITALLVAWITVSWQSVKAAMMNPVKSLRTE